MKVLAILALPLVLSACAGLSTVGDKGKEVAAKVADEQMTTAVWSLCNAASLGSLRRMFETDAEREELLAWCDRVQSTAR